MYSYMLDSGQEITNLGTVYPVKLKNMQKLSMYGWVVEKNKKSLNRENDDMSLLEMLVEEDLNQEDENKRGLFLHCLTEFIKLTTCCEKVEFNPSSLTWFVGEDTEEKDERCFLNSTNFEEFREITSKQNLIFEKRYHKPAFQKRLDKAMKARRKKNKGISIDSMITIVSLEMGILSKYIVEEMSYIEFIAMFQRIQLRESARASIQYASSGNFKDIKIEDYAKELDLFKHPEDGLFKSENPFRGKI